MTQSELARRCECSQQAISRIVLGGRPKTALAKKLKEVLNIDEDAWLTSEEERGLRRIKRRNTAA